MSTEIHTTGVPPQAMADLEDAARYAASDVRDPDVMRRACECMDRTREELRKQFGEMNVAVDLVREVRDEA
jgi:hypothetical protein